MRERGSHLVNDVKYLRIDNSIMVGPCSLVYWMLLRLDYPLLLRMPGG